MSASVRRYLFILGKDRREKGGFIGALSVQQQLKDGPTRRRVGLLVEGAPARRKLYTPFFSIVIAKKKTMIEGAKILSPSGEEELGELIYDLTGYELKNTFAPQASSRQVFHHLH